MYVRIIAIIDITIDRQQLSTFRIYYRFLDKSEEENRRRLQRNESGNEDPAAMPAEEAKHQEDKYYEEGIAVQQIRTSKYPITKCLRR